MYKCVKISAAAVISAAVVLSAAVFFISDHSSRAITASSEGSVQMEQSLPVIMYHSVLSDPSRTGDYVITPDEFEKDLIYIKSKGMNTVTPDMIIDYVDNGTPLPEGPIRA